jgi:hypothetical protein
MFQIAKTMSVTKLFPRPPPPPPWQFVLKHFFLKTEVGSLYALTSWMEIHARHALRFFHFAVLSFWDQSSKTQAKPLTHMHLQHTVASNWRVSGGPRLGDPWQK